MQNNKWYLYKRLMFNMPKKITVEHLIWIIIWIMYLLSHEIKRFCALKKVCFFPLLKVTYENLRYKYNIDGINNTFQQKVYIVDRLLRFRQNQKLRYKQMKTSHTHHQISVSVEFESFYNLYNNSIRFFEKKVIDIFTILCKILK